MASDPVCGHLARTRERVTAQRDGAVLLAAQAPSKGSLGAGIAMPSLSASGRLEIPGVMRRELALDQVTRGLK